MTTKTRLELADNEQVNSMDDALQNKKPEAI